MFGLTDGEQENKNTKTTQTQGQTQQGESSDTEGEEVLSSVGPLPQVQQQQQQNPMMQSMVFVQPQKDSMMQFQQKEECFSPPFNQREVPGGEITIQRQERQDSSLGQSGAMFVPQQQQQGGMFGSMVSSGFSQSLSQQQQQQNQISSFNDHVSSESDGEESQRSQGQRSEWGEEIQEPTGTQGNEITQRQQVQNQQPSDEEEETISVPAQQTFGQQLLQIAKLLVKPNEWFSLCKRRFFDGGGKGPFGGGSAKF